MVRIIPWAGNSGSERSSPKIPNAEMPRTRPDHSGSHGVDMEFTGSGEK